MSKRKQLRIKGAKPRRRWTLVQTPAEIVRQQAAPQQLPAPEREADRLAAGNAQHTELAAWIRKYLDETPDAPNAAELQAAATRFEKFSAAANDMREGNMPAAIETLREIIASEPNDHLAKLNLAQCLVSTGEQEAAINVLDEIATLYANSPRYVIARSRALTGVGKRDEGVKLLFETAAKFPKNFTFQQELIRIGELIPVEQDAKHIERTKCMPRAKFYEALIHECDRHEKDKNLLSLAAIANQQLEANVPHVAMHAARCLLKHQPDSISTRLLAARAESRAGEHEAAEKNFKLVLEAEPKNVDALAGLGFVYSATQRTDDARKVLLEALDIDPNHVHAAELFVLLHPDDENRFAAARQLRERYPDAWLPVKLLGDLDVRFGMIEEALVKHREAFEQSRSDDALTMVLHDLDRLDRAEEAASIVDKIPKISARGLTVRWNAANIYLKAGHLDKAASLLESIVRDRKLPPATRFSANVLLTELMSNA